LENKLLALGAHQVVETHIIISELETAQEKKAEFKESLDKLIISQNQL